MGQSSAATVTEIEQIRGRLETNMRELERRVPEPAVWARRAGVIVLGGGTAAIVLRSLLRRRREKRRERRRGPREGTMLQPVVQVVPEEVAERVAGALDHGRWKPWVAGATGLWLAVRVIELRQLRRLNRALVAPRP